MKLEDLQEICCFKNHSFYRIPGRKDLTFVKLPEGEDILRVKIFNYLKSEGFMDGIDRKLFGGRGHVLGFKFEKLSEVWKYEKDKRDDFPTIL
jgi:hypothetical protein